MEYNILISDTKISEVFDIIEKFKKMLDFCISILYTVFRYRKEGKVKKNSRAEYFKKRREKLKDFGVLVDRKRLEELEKKLKNENRTKTSWINEKIDEELKK